MTIGCQKEESELLLPEELIARASMRGNDYAWRKRDVLHVAAEAERIGLACGGWKVLFRTLDGDCELCWYSFYTEKRDDSETWEEFLARSWQNSRLKWRKLFKEGDFVEEGRKAFRLIRKAEDSALLPRDALWFVIYFRSSESVDPERKPAHPRKTPCSADEDWELGLCREESRSGPRANDPGKNC